MTNSITVLDAVLERLQMRLFRLEQCEDPEYCKKYEIGETEIGLLRALKDATMDEYRRTIDLADFWRQCEEDSSKKDKPFESTWRHELNDSDREDALNYIKQEFEDHDGLLEYPDYYAYNIHDPLSREP